MKTIQKLVFAAFAIAFASAAFAQTVPQTYTAVEGKKVVISATADGTTPFTYQWTKDTTVLGTVTSSLTITSIVLADAGTYSAKLANSAGSASASVVLVVWQLPKITTQPADASVTIGSGATFTAAASGFPAPTLQWFKGTTAIAGATGASYSIPAIAAADAGSYSVVATNSAGTVTSRAAVLTPIAIAPTVVSLTVTIQ